MRSFDNIRLFAGPWRTMFFVLVFLRQTCDVIGVAAAAAENVAKGNVKQLQRLTTNIGK